MQGALFFISRLMTWSEYSLACPWRRTRAAIALKAKWQRLLAFLSRFEFSSEMNSELPAPPLL